tara:strand:+ start:260 stop:481 length:222 start_codon:yes stop_codon:yes gene_type:complete
MERDNKNNSILSDAITEMIWTASHNNKDYGLQEAKILSLTLKVPLSTIMKIIKHAKRTPKGVDWDIIKSRNIN